MNTWIFSTTTVRTDNVGRTCKAALGANLILSSDSVKV